MSTGLLDAKYEVRLEETRDAGFGHTFTVRAHSRESALLVAQELWEELPGHADIEHVRTVFVRSAR